MSGHRRTDRACVSGACSYHCGGAGARAGQLLAQLCVAQSMKWSGGEQKYMQHLGISIPH